MWRTAPSSKLRPAILVGIGFFALGSFAVAPVTPRGLTDDERDYLAAASNLARFGDFSSATPATAGALLGAVALVRASGAVAILGAVLLLVLARRRSRSSRPSRWRISPRARPSRGGHSSSSARRSGPRRSTSASLSACCSRPRSCRRSSPRAERRAGAGSAGLRD